VQPPHFGERQVRARGIVRVRDKDDPRARRHRRENRIHVGRVIPLRRNDGLSARGERRVAINEEAVLREDRLIARCQVRLRDQA
jgi:hypothetical protein